MYWNKRAKSRAKMLQYAKDSEKRLASIAEKRIAATSTSIEAQCARQGFGFSWVDPHGLLTGPYHYNSSVLRVGQDLWLAYRRQRKTRESDVCCVNLEPESLQPIPDTNRILVGDHHSEDPRLFWYAGAPWLCNVAWRGVTTTCWIELRELDAESSEERRALKVEWGRNWAEGVVQKNWTFFDHDGELMLIYASAPAHEVLRVDPETGACVQVGAAPGLAWRRGVVRGGSPPVRLGDRYFSFFHSRAKLEAHGRYVYFMGAYSFEAALPFRPLSMTPDFLLHGSDEDENLSQLPLVVFPCGAVLRKDEWAVSVGVNDVSTGMVRIKHEELLKHLEPL